MWIVVIMLTLKSVYQKDKLNAKLKTLFPIMKTSVIYNDKYFKK